MTAAAVTAPYRWGYADYSNPYYVTDDSSAYVNYAQPIGAAAAAETTQSAAGQPTAQDEAVALFDAARGAFMKGDYQAALDGVNKAIQKLPSDAVLHEFRALCQFAMGQYKPAAGTLYAVLSVGPGWDWTTMSGLYPSVDAYTQQLRVLEKYVTGNPTVPEGHFVLAYHYLTMGEKRAAADQYAKVVELNPQENLSKQLLASLGGGSGDKPTPSEPPKPRETAASAKPVDADSIVGTWKSSRPDGSSIALNLAKDNKYAWKYTVRGKTQEFSGAYTLADNVLILKQNDQATMVGQVSLPSANQMNFKLAGGDAADPGLTFSK
ncbi:MAG: tetratricopeptide repeat protein [Planctomycetaceae bacterium]